MQIGYKLVSKFSILTNEFIKKDLIPAYSSDNAIYWNFENETVILVCVVFADPLPFIDFAVSQNGKTKTSSFIAKNVVYTWNLYEKTELISFNCSAENSVGKTFKEGLIYRVRSFEQILIDFIPFWLPPLALFAFVFCVFLDGWRRYQTKLLN